jgi:putative Holliday junction resolvase
MLNKDDFKYKKILAIDYGRKFTGLASYKVEVDPYPLMHGRIAFESESQLISKLKSIVEEDLVDIILIGIPFFTDGKASTMTKTIQDFSKLLQNEIDIPLYERDETLTTFEAKERMKSDPRFNFQVDLKQIDALSAVIILEEFVKDFSN